MSSNFPTFTYASDEDVLKLAIKQAQIDLVKINGKLVELQDLHKDKSPKTLYEKMLQNYNSLTEKLTNLKFEYLNLHDEYKRLEAKQKELLSSRDVIYRDVVKLKRDRTPKPNWSKCASHVSIGVNAFLKLLNVYSSDELLDFLLNEFIGGNDSTNTKHELTTKNIDNDALPAIYIRARNDIAIKNFKLCKRDLLIILRDILSAKYEYDRLKKQQNQHQAEKFTSFVFLYFRKKFQSISLAIQWFYNVIDCLDRYSHEDFIAFFKGLVENDIDEELFYGFIQVSYEVYTDLNKTAVEETHLDSLRYNTSDSSSSSTDSVVITKQGFCDVLQKKFLFLTAKDVEELFSMAFMDMKQYYNKKSNTKMFYEVSKNGDYIHFKVLFLEEIDGTISQFLRLLKNKLDLNRHKYVQEIYKQLLHVKLGKHFKPTDAELRRDQSGESQRLKKNKSPTIAAVIEKNKDPPRRQSKSKKKFSLAAKKQDDKHISSFNKETDICEPEHASLLVNTDEIIKALRKADVSINDVELERYLKWIFRKDFEQKELSLGVVIKDLQNFNCHNHTNTQIKTRTKKVKNKKSTRTSKLHDSLEDTLRTSNSSGNSSILTHTTTILNMM